MCLYKIILYVKLLVARQFFLSLCSALDVAQRFLNILENFKLVLLNLLIKKRADSNLNADQSNFLENKTVRDVLELYVKNNFIQNNSRPKSNYKMIY